MALAWLSAPTGAFAVPWDRACSRGTTILMAPPWDDGSGTAPRRPARGRSAEPKDVICVTFRWGLADAHGQSRTLAVVYGHNPSPLASLLRLHSTVRACTVEAEPSRVAEGAGLNAQWHRQTQITITVPARNQETAHHPRGMFPRQLAPSAGSGPSTASCACRTSKSPFIQTNSRGHCLPPFTTRIPRGIHRCLVLPEGESPWTSGCAGRFGELSRTTSAAPSSCSVLTRFAAAVSGTSSLSRTCAPDLDISRRTPYEWRVKDRAPSVHHVSERRPACPPLRISALAVCPFTCQAMTTDTRGQTCMPFYGKAGRFPSGTEGDYPAEKFWA